MFFDHDEKKADVIAIFSPLSKSKITREMTENAVMKGGVSPKGKEPPHGFKNTKKKEDEERGKCHFHVYVVEVECRVVHYCMLEGVEWRFGFGFG